MPSQPESNSCHETLNGNGNTPCATNLTDSHDSIHQESHKIIMQPKCNQFYLFALCFVIQGFPTNIYLVIKLNNLRVKWIDRILV